MLGVVISRFDNQPAAVLFKNKLERRNVKVFTHRFTKGYPTDVELIVSDEGYGANEYLKTEILSEKTVSLDLNEALIALSISATTNPAAQLAIEKLKELHGCEVHTTHIPTPGDEAGLRRLGVNVTSDPNFSTKDLFIT